MIGAIIISALVGHAPASESTILDYEEQKPQITESLPADHYQPNACVSSEVEPELKVYLRTESLVPHFQAISQWHTAMARLNSGHRRSIYWKRIRSRCFVTRKPHPDLDLTIIVVIF